MMLAVCYVSVLITDIEICPERFITEYVLSYEPQVTEYIKRNVNVLIFVYLSMFTSRRRHTFFGTGLD